MFSIRASGAQRRPQHRATGVLSYSVYRAHDTKLKREVAIKILRRRSSAGEFDCLNPKQVEKIATVPRFRTRFEGSVQWYPKEIALVVGPGENVC